MVNVLFYPRNVLRVTQAWYEYSSQALIPMHQVWSICMFKMRKMRSIAFDVAVFLKFS